MFGCPGPAALTEPKGGGTKVVAKEGRTLWDWNPLVTGMGSGSPYDAEPLSSGSTPKQVIDVRSRLNSKIPSECSQSTRGLLG